MKKVIFAAMLILIAGTAFAQTFHPANQKTVAWDAADNATLYRVFVRPAPGGEAVHVGQTSEISYVVTVPDEGRWFVGVQSVREVDGQVVGESVIAWSSDPEACFDGATFGIIHYLPPSAVKGLRVQ